MILRHRGLLALTLALLASPLPVRADEAAGRRAPTIHVTGVGEATARPDIAVTMLTVVRNEATARGALDAANQAMADVASAMKDGGVAVRDLQTSGFSINPQYRYTNASDGTQAPPVLVGYEVRNSLSVRIRDIARTGELLDKAVTAGVNQGGDIAFVVDDPSAAKAEARRKAVADATATARLLAETAGVALGPLISIELGGAEAAPRPMQASRMAMAAASMDKSVPVEAGESTISAEVDMTFEIGAALPK